jgi:hypothetical protein
LIKKKIYIFFVHANNSQLIQTHLRNFHQKKIVFLFLIEILAKIINHTNKETDLKALHPVVYGRVLYNLGQKLVAPNGQQ